MLVVIVHGKAIRHDIILPLKKNFNSLFFSISETSASNSTGIIASMYLALYELQNHTSHILTPPSETELGKTNQSFVLTEAYHWIFPDGNFRSHSVYLEDLDSCIYRSILSPTILVDDKTGD